MPIPLVLGVCEDDIERDSAFLKAFASPTTDFRVTPTLGGTPAAKEARVLRRQFEAAKRAGFVVGAFLVHWDADRTSVDQRRRVMAAWFQDHGLAALGARLICCVPHPCTEAWLCHVFRLRASRANPAAGCAPWKRAWERAHGHDLDPVRQAALSARRALASRPDFQQFMADWNAAGLQ